MSKILGIEPYKLIAAAAAIGLAAVFLSVLIAGPATIIDGAFNVLSQSVATAGVAVSGLVASSAGIVAQGVGAAANAVAQAGLVIGQTATGALGAAGSILEIAGATVGAITTLNSAVLSSGTQALGAMASGSLQLIQQYGQAIYSTYSAISETRVYVYQVLAQNQIILMSNYYQAVALACSQLFSTLFTSLSAAAGQLFSIPLIAVYGYVSIGSALAGVVPGVVTSVLGVFVNLFNKITNIFTGGDFIAAIEAIPVTIGDKIVEGFGNLLAGLGGQLQTVFFP